VPRPTSLKAVISESAFAKSELKFHQSSFVLSDVIVVTFILRKSRVTLYVAAFVAVIFGLESIEGTDY
jgi:hypothetical protein